MDATYITLSLTRNYDEEITCLVCNLGKCEKSVMLQGGGRRVWHGIHEMCAMKLQDGNSREFTQMFDNLTSTQARSTELIQSERAAKKLLREVIEPVPADSSEVTDWLPGFRARVQEFLK